MRIANSSLVARISDFSFLLFPFALPSAHARRLRLLLRREFLARHAEVFLCADMFQKEVWTFRGLTTAFVFFVIHLQTRKALLARATFSPTNQWIKQQIRHVIWECEDQGIDNKIPSEYNSKVEIAKLKIAGETHVSQIHRKEFLGGLLKSYYRKVA